MSTLLGIDIGTSSVKAILFAPDGSRVMAVAGQEYPIAQPKPMYAEQNPEDWWQAAVQVVRRVISDSGVRPDSIRAIGLTGQMHGTVLLDAQNQPLAPAIIWADQRSASVIPAMIDAVGEHVYTATAGTPPAAGFMGATLVWLQRHQPELIAQTHTVLLPKDEIRRRLTGHACTEVSDAASTALLDVRSGQWATPLIETLGLPTHIFPDVMQSTDIAGELTRQAADALGLPAGLPVVAGCADQPAQALANGVLQPGRASVTVGTGGQVFVPVTASTDGHLKTDSRLHVFNHAAPGHWYILGAILSAGLSLRWLRNLLGLSGNPEAYGLLSQEAAQVSPGADGLFFLPYLLGERTPHMDPQARGAFVGLTYRHERGHLARAVMEGVGFALRQTFEISGSLGGTADLIIASGGGMESDVWRGIMADILGLPLQKTLLAEQTCIGAAMLAGTAAGLYTDIETAAEAVACYGPTTEPNKPNYSQYNDYYNQFIDLYPHLRADFHRIALTQSQL